MTEAEWHECTDSQPMLAEVWGAKNERKLRLFAVACGRHVWQVMTDRRHRDVVDSAERFADGLMSGAEFRDNLRPVVALFDDMLDFVESEWSAFQYMTVATRYLELIGNVRWATLYAVRGLASQFGPEDSPEWLAARQSEDTAHCHILREIFGNPFRPVAIDPAWLTWNHGTVPAIARQVDDDRALHDLPILADALEEAGCTNADLLGHCRGPGPHVRGCWAVDLLLGKT